MCVLLFDVNIIQLNHGKSLLIWLYNIIGVEKRLEHGAVALTLSFYLIQSVFHLSIPRKDN